jgi:hypothetical protein
VSERKQLLILPDTRKFNRTQTKELSDAGFIVVYLADPSKARLISSEMQPISTNHMFLAALRAIRKANDSSAYQALVENLIAAAVDAQSE